MQLLPRVSPAEYLARWEAFDEGARALALTPADRNLAWRDHTADEHFYEWPVPVEHFAADPYYVGPGANLRPAIRDILADFGDPDELYETLVVIGGVGSGKSFSASILNLYALYLLSTMREPHHYLSSFPSVDLASDTELAVITSSAAGARQAKAVIFNHTSEKVQGSPYFARHFVPEVMGTQINFPRRVRYAYGTSQAKSVLGLNVFAWGIDEAAFGDSEDDARVNVASVKALFDQLHTRRRSRFGALGWGGMFTSPQAEGDFVEMLADQQRQTGSRILVRRIYTWEAKQELFPGAKGFLLDRDPERPRIVREDLVYVSPGLAQDPATGELVRFGPSAPDPSEATRETREAVIDALGRDAA